MTKFNLFLAAIVVAILTACSGSDTYQGNWKATDVDGNKYEIAFEPKSFSVTTEEGKTSSFGYSQNSINISNSVETYGISMDDGRSYQINFPIAQDESVGTMADGNGNLLYTISRDAYKEYDDIFRLD